MADKKQESFWQDFIDGMYKAMCDDIEYNLIKFDPRPGAGFESLTLAVWKDGFKRGIYELTLRLKRDWARYGNSVEGEKGEDA